MTGTRPSADQRARRRAQTEFARPLVLEAGAGTGKTTALVARLLAWSLGVGWDRTREDLRTGGATEPGDDQLATALLERVVAITFTDAAAAEMAERFQRELARLGDDREPADGGAPWPPPWLFAEAFPPERTVRSARARALLAAVDRLRVQTIHSFAFGLLRGHALELGLHPALAVDAEELALDEALHTTLTDLLPPRYRAGDPALEHLARAGIGPREIAEAARALAGFGLEPAELERDPFTAAAIAAALAPLAASAAALLARIDRHALPKKLTGAESLRLDLGRLAAALAPLPRDRAGLERVRSELVERPGKSARNKLDAWRRGKLAAAELELFGDEADELVREATGLHRDLALVASLDAPLLEAARSIVAPVLREVERRLRARGAVTFSDILRLAVRLLDRTGLATRLRRGIRQLLVDEFQDTDELQARLVRRLALDGPAEERPGLFLVGDPKQSIYGWRRARLGVYRELVRSATGTESGEPMTANFRSVAGLLEEVERVCAPLMPEQSETEARYEPLEARGERRREAATIEYWLTWPGTEERASGKERLTAGEAARREAAAVAVDLAARIASGELLPSRAAILVRGKTHLEAYLEALRERGVAFAVEKDRSYFRRRETVDAAALVRAVLDPADLVALTTLLRSPFVGVPDAALVPLFRAGLPERLARATHADAATLAELDALVERAAAAVPEAVPGLDRLASWPLSLRAALAALVERRAAFDHEEVHLWVDRLRAAWPLELVAAARYQGAHRLANLDRFFRDLAGRLEAGEAPHRLVADLRRTVAEGADAPEARPLETADDAVRVMTLHTAKGLEFEEVYLVGLHQGTGAHRAAPAHAAERVGERWEYRLFGVPTPGFVPVRDLDERIRAAEQVRLLYVGMTRAIRRLVLVGSLPAGGVAVAPGDAQSLSDLLARRVPTDPSFRDQVAEAGDAGLRDGSGALWRCLPPPTGAANRSSGRTIPDPPVAVDALLAARARERERAAQRQSRRRHATISALAEAAAAEAERDSDELETPRFPALRDEARDEALARGTALHRALELAPVAVEEPERWRAVATAAFERALPGASQAARARFAARLERLARSVLLARLEALAPRVLARELPVLLAAAEGLPEGPLEALAGAVDLVYLDPADGSPVIADFKSDRVDEEGIAALAARYASQLELYAQAVRQGLGLAAAPRQELWLLELDRIVPLA